MEVFVCPFVRVETNERHPFANGLNGLAHLCEMACKNVGYLQMGKMFVRSEKLDLALRFFTVVLYPVGQPFSVLVFRRSRHCHKYNA